LLAPFLTTKFGKQKKQKQKTLSMGLQIRKFQVTVLVVVLLYCLIIWKFQTTEGDLLLNVSLEISPPEIASKSESLSLNDISEIPTSESENSFADDESFEIPNSAPSNLVENDEVSISSENESFEVNSRDKFLVYASHSGYSNQILGLASAAILARFANRVLVIPPVLSHYQIVFGGFARCNPEGQSKAIFEAVRDYRLRKKEGDFETVFDFQPEFLFQRSGLKIISWDEFENLNLSNWAQETSSFGCLEKKNASLEEMKMTLRKWDSSRVLQIGSAFMSPVRTNLHQEQDTNLKIQTKFLLEYFAYGLPVREEISAVAGQLLRGSFASPEDIFAVHIRTGDQNQQAREFIEKTSRKIDEILLRYNVSSPVEIYVATDLPKGVKDPLLVEAFAKYDEFADLKHLGDNLDNELLLNAAKKLRMTEDLLSIVLDQHVCATSKFFYSCTYESTFSEVIRKRRSRAGLLGFAV
jgi:hypothetical protein